MTQVEIAILVGLGLIVVAVGWAVLRPKPNAVQNQPTITIQPSQTVNTGLFTSAFTSGLQRADQIVHDRTANGVADTMLALLAPQPQPPPPPTSTPPKQ